MASKAFLLLGLAFANLLLITSEVAARDLAETTTERKIESPEEGPAIRMYKDTRFREETGWVNEIAKQNYKEMKEKFSQVSHNSDGTNPIINDVEIVKNQLGIRKGYRREFGNGFVAPSHQRASSSFEEASIKRVKNVEEKNAQLTEKVTSLEEKLDTIQKLLEQQRHLLEQQQQQQQQLLEQ
ncbi:uncharacterized protein LOC132302791 isoform X2 [Cornus florida]|uniref:uncharacterized protein LOC132302791 isoform X2 n=1 Tax=Cornus florida TaxID=4283 RepID=UPI00289A8C50|nr:uncharacterized protein LOC132302791 isoform X2 [Cornus florida]XP_059655717.1 uncharacterized protein LOC132302791 isoform X2 [Cornus florida]XP_059655718.1 uncharacterized protein LOC132302791 isoform X2 [Cornus florida]XP_059655719.1 uncharacterized protein LOC132302791 isoform X2 [Cornus florida]XP_059655720.1 uncharacterized protein LOC132302791 isoform X2 [Cornus florida]XP_059655722.1 uncharacterized protein LOC132302791 isoform X2 [Cornus florida]